MANDATMTIKAVFLPDEIQKTLENQTMTMSVGTGVLKWWYGLVNAVPESKVIIPATAADVLGSGAASSPSRDAGSAIDTIAAADEIRFIFIKNMGTTEDGSTVTAESVYVNISGEEPHDGTVSGSGETYAYDQGSIEIGSGEVWYAKTNNTKADFLIAAGGAGYATGDTTGKVQCLIAVVVDTT